MPLHEYEEKKRRQNIDTLNASGACHICGSTARNTRGFSHCLDDENSEQQPRYHYNEMGTSLIPAPQTAPMRSCACFNQSKSDPDYWPYSLRVCEMCIADDCTTGRVRNCGMCGAVACDADCGVEMAECTDNEGWNNMGCLECRRKECFSEIDVFKTATKGPDGRDVPKMTRVCVKCLEQCTPWVRYDFTCRLFKCNTRLVPSDVMERKRFRTFGSSPLNLLPEDGLAAIVDFLPNNDLKSLYLTNSAMCTVSERVAQTRVEAFHHEFPTGPLVVGTRKSPFGGHERRWIRCEGTNDFNIRAPEDGKVWVGILHYLEYIAKEAFYLGFQTDGENGDEDAVCRFMKRQDKFQFSQVYIKDGPNSNSPIVPRPEHFNSSADGVSICSSFILITDASVKVPFAVASSEDMVSGRNRFICRLFCPGSGTKNSNRDSLGSYGILCKSTSEAGTESITWAKKLDIMEGLQREDSVFGLDYNTETRELIVHCSRMNRFHSNEYTLPEMEGDLVFGVEFTAKAACMKGSLMSARRCDEDEWTQFLTYTQNGEPAPAGGPGDLLQGGLDMLGLVRQRRREQDGEDNRDERIRARLDDADEAINMGVMRVRNHVALRMGIRAEPAPVMAPLPDAGDNP